MDSSKIPTVIYYDEGTQSVRRRRKLGQSRMVYVPMPRSSPVHTAPNLRESAKNERERTTGRVGGFVLAAIAL